MGFEDEAEQSIRRPCHRANDRSKRPNEFTSSIVPRGTSFHRWVELEFPLLLLMPEAVHTDLVFTISLKRSTQNLQLSTSSPADYSIYQSRADMARLAVGPTRSRKTRNGHGACIAAVV